MSELSQKLLKISEKEIQKELDAIRKEWFAKGAEACLLGVAGAYEVVYREEPEAEIGNNGMWPPTRLANKIEVNFEKQEVVLLITRP